MRIERKVIIALVLIIGVITEGIIYERLNDKVYSAKSVYNECKDKYDRKIKESNSLEYSNKSFGYGEILDLLNKDAGVNITKFEKDESSDKVVVKIETTTEERELNRVISSISGMENFQRIRKLSIRSEDKAQIHIAIDAEYKINR